jgi:hypothetical protein
VSFGCLRRKGTLLEEPIAIGLVFLWICLAASVGLALTPNLEIDLILIGLIPAGFIGAAGMSGRGRWWWLYGAIAFLILFPAAAVAPWLADTAYPPSAFDRLPFTAGAGSRWEMFVFLLGVAAATLIALRSPTPSAQLWRAALAGLTALGYLVAWDGVPLGAASAWEVVLAITLLLAAIGLGDVIADVVSDSGISGRVATVAIFLICLTLLVLVAGVTWRALLGYAFFGSFSDADNDVLPLATIAAVLAGTLGVSYVAGRRLTLREER